MRTLPILLALVLLLAACTHTNTSTRLAPVADHHQHLISPAAAALRSEPPLPSIQLPDELAALLRERAARWNDEARLAELFTEDAVVLDPFGPVWLQGRRAAANYLGGLFSDPYEIEPIAYGIEGNAGHITGYMTEEGKEGPYYFAHVQLSLRKGSDGAWRIAAESPLFEGPPVLEPVTAEDVVKQLDDAGSQRAAVLSVAYWFGSGLRTTPVPDEYEKVRAENDWVAAEVSKYPARLVGVCSFNPLRDYAMTELDRCAANPAFKAVKLHFGNSAVDVRKPEHAEAIRAMFRAINDRKLGIVAHLWTDPAFEKEGRAHAEVFLDQLLPAAPDVPVQIAHMAGGGRSTDQALAVFADAIAKGDPRTKNVYFDVATLTGGQSDAGLAKDAARMRQIGLDRIVYGTDTAPPNPPVKRSWATFRAFMPLTDEELNQIARNVVPYMK